MRNALLPVLLLLIAGATSAGESGGLENNEPPEILEPAIALSAYEILFIGNSHSSARLVKTGQ